MQTTINHTKKANIVVYHSVGSTPERKSENANFGHKADLLNPLHTGRKKRENKNGGDNNEKVEDRWARQWRTCSSAKMSQLWPHGVRGL